MHVTLICKGAWMGKGTYSSKIEIEDNKLLYRYTYKIKKSEMSYRSLSHAPSHINFIITSTS